MSETKTLCFSINGEWITQFARDIYWTEDKDYEYVKELLLACLECDEPYERRITWVNDILNGKLQIVGNSNDDDYGVAPDNTDIAKLYEVYTGKRITALKYEIFGEIDTPIKELENKIDVFKDKLEDEEYGWLSPDGKFTPVDFANHSSWASEYVFKHYPESLKNIETHRKAYLYPKDFLHSKGWVLLHNPQFGKSKLSMETGRTLTKAQKEFLFDYYIKRNRRAEANALYED